MMETLKLRTQVDADGTLHLTVPQHFANQQVEVVVVLQTVTQRDALGWPVDFFARLDAIVADDMLERGDQGIPEVRES